MIRSEKGIALVLTLMVLVLVSALVVEFAYGVYTTTSGLYNWRDSQRLSFVAKSGTSLAVKTISDNRALLTKYATQERYTFPVENILGGFNGGVVITIEDENAKFNLNWLRSDRTNTRREAYASFKRLLDALNRLYAVNLDERIADLVTNWLVKDSGLSRSQDEPSKDAYMDSVDELLMIKGIDNETYQKLLPYVTVYALDERNPQIININTASIPVIMCFGVTRDQAEEILQKRRVAPFTPDNRGVLGASLMGNVAFEPSNLRVTVTAEENKIRRILECVVSIGSSASTVKYWREM